MNSDFKGSFLRDLKSVKDSRLLKRIGDVIHQVEQAENLQSLRSVTRLQGKGSYYRIRVGDYRLGLILVDNTVIFVRCLHRREIYKYFP